MGSSTEISDEQWLKEHGYKDFAWFVRLCGASNSMEGRTILRTMRESSSGAESARQVLNGLEKGRVEPEKAAAEETVADVLKEIRGSGHVSTKDVEDTLRRMGPG